MQFSGMFVEFHRGEDDRILAITVLTDPMTSHHKDLSLGLMGFFIKSCFFCLLNAVKFEIRCCQMDILNILLHMGIKVKKSPQHILPCSRFITTGSALASSLYWIVTNCIFILGYVFN